MDSKRLALAFAPPVLALAACSGGAAPQPPAADSLDAVAEGYVKLVLAVGRHDPLYVDAFYGPPAWKAESEGGTPAPLPELRARAASLLDALRRSGGPADRARYLEKQLIAVEARVRLLQGDRMTLGDECRLLYDADPPRHDVAEFETAQKVLEQIVPGTGPLAPRIEALRRAVYVPRDRLGATVEAALAAARKANAPFVSLPASERFETVLVSGKPWGAYNWYLGHFRSRIEFNTDLPAEANNVLGTMCHEGYPGHHVYNVLLEEKLVNGKRWVEYTVYPLYSPQSLLAEGTANLGIDIIFSDDERRRALAEVIAPASGVPATALLEHDRVWEAMKPLRYVGGEAARMLLDEGRPDDEVVAFLVRWGLVTQDRARKSVDFARTYRSYVFNYSLGEDIVRAYCGAGPDRRERFYGLLSRPVVPSDLTR